MTAAELIDTITEILLANNLRDMPVHLICNGKIDENPEVNTDDGIIYLEGVTKEEK